MNNEIKQLKNRVDILENENRKLKNRFDSGMVSHIEGEPIGLPPSTTYTANTGFRRDIELTGDVQTITVPAYPIKFIKIKGLNFYIPLHTFSQITA